MFRGLGLPEAFCLSAVGKDTGCFMDLELRA